MMPLRTILFVAILLSCSVSCEKKHHYALKGNLKDEFGGPDLRAYGGSIDGSGYHFAPMQGLSFKSDDISSEYTIVISLTLGNCGNGRWCKILDFANRITDKGLYVERQGLLSLFLANGGNTGTTVVGSQPQTITMTRSATGFVNIYLGKLGTSSNPEIGCNDTAGSTAVTNQVLWIVQAIQTNEFPAGTVTDLFISNKARPGPTVETHPGCHGVIPPLDRR